ncbi:MAG TPA: hypothetical protein VGL94_17530 [Ktedonobacteraceae bacterium]|jgi:hypothetical protein
MARQSVPKDVGNDKFKDGASWAVNCEISLRQYCIPVHLQGRINAVISLLVGGIAPLGTLLAGVVSEYIGIRLTLLCGACGMLLLATWLPFVLSGRQQ